MYHTVILAGNVGRDPEMRYTPSGTAVTSFSVADSRNRTGADGQQIKEVIWFRVTTWNKLAETCAKYLKKGSKVLVEGTLQSDSNGNPKTFQRNDGTTGASFEITGNTVRFLSSAGEVSGEAHAEPEQTEEVPL